MPKDSIDYSNTIIYKIICKDPKIRHTHIGHTTNFVKRKYQHKLSCNNGKQSQLYDTIRHNGGWDNWEMIEIANYNCRNVSEARMKEKEHHELLNASSQFLSSETSSQIPTFTCNTVWMTNDDIRGQKSINENKTLYSCDICDYNTSIKINFEKHLATDKHLRMTNDDIRGQKVSKVSNPNNLGFRCECGRAYKHRQGLWKHKRECNHNHNNHNNRFDTIADKDLIMMLIKDNNELRTMMMEQHHLMLENNNKVIEMCKNGTHTTNYTHTNSHNKAFNLNFFLNETCKNAMNIMEFAESIQLQLSDLENIGKVGYVEGISNIIVKNLKALDVTERPIHCADKKREVIYIKDDDKWEKEDPEKKTIKKVISKVAFKNQRLLPKFKEAHPGCNMAESKYSDQYSKIVIEAMGGAGDNDDEKTDNIIKNIVKEVIIDKIEIKNK